MKGLLLLCGYVLLMGQCKNYDNVEAAQNITVPPYTEKGANTLGFYMNGAPWTNFGKTYLSNGINGQYKDNIVRGTLYYDPTTKDTSFYISGGLTITKKGREIRDEHINLSFVKKGNGVGYYSLDSGQNYIYFDNYISLKNYYSSKRNPVVLELRNYHVKSINERVMSGTFSGYIYNYILKDSIHITGGVFDVTVKP